MAQTKRDQEISRAAATARQPYARKIIELEQTITALKTENAKARALICHYIARMAEIRTACEPRPADDWKE